MVNANSVRVYSYLDSVTSFAFLEFSGIHTAEMDCVVIIPNPAATGSSMATCHYSCKQLVLVIRIWYILDPIGYICPTPRKQIISPYLYSAVPGDNLVSLFIVGTFVFTSRRFSLSLVMCKKEISDWGVITHPN